MNWTDSIIIQNKTSDWRVEFLGAGMTCIPPAGATIPNAFWRFMQFICFGVKWTKQPKNKV